jgi:hypothetical protein
MSLHDFSLHSEGVEMREERYRSWMAVMICYLVNMQIPKGKKKLKPSDVFGTRKEKKDRKEDAETFEVKDDDTQPSEAPIRVRMRAADAAVKAKLAEQFWNSAEGRRIMRAVGDEAPED